MSVNILIYQKMRKVIIITTAAFLFLGATACDKHDEKNHDSDATTLEGSAKNTNDNVIKDSDSTITNNANDQIESVKKSQDDKKI